MTRTLRAPGSSSRLESRPSTALKPKPKRFSPEALLEATRRSPAAPSPDGKYVLFTNSTYSFESHSGSSEIRIMGVTTLEETVITTDSTASEPRWTGDGYEIVWLKAGENGNTSLVVSNATNPKASYTAGTISGPVSNFKLLYIKSGMVAIAVAGQATPDGDLYNPHDAPKQHSSARVYDALFVRHWDTFIQKQRNSIFTGLLQKSLSKTAGQENKYGLIGFTNALKGTGLECPIPPFGGTDHFDIGRKGLVIVAKDPDLDPATHTKCNTYFIPREDLMDMSYVEPIQFTVPGYHGAATSPVFSPDGTALAFLKMQEDGYESDKNKLVVARGFSHDAMAVDILASSTVPPWDRSPSSITWSYDGQDLYLVAEDLGQDCLFEVHVPDTRNPNDVTLRQLTFTYSIASVTVAAKGTRNLIISASSLTDNSIYFILDPTLETEAIIFSSGTLNGSTFGLSPAQVKQFWWIGDNDHSVHAWVVLPSFFNPEHKYPLAYVIHGGPQGAWNDAWSTRWNPAVFAEQGYVVVLPNPTGSTGYGQPFTDAIKNNWGGSPYIDLVKGIEHIESQHPYIDTSRAVALGASYGGYMMNWIQGQPLASKFKALVCHDGVFSMSAQLSSDEIYFPTHDLGGPIWERQEIYDKYDPSRYLKNWNTPMLVIHNDLDFRLPVSEGLAAFNVLQTKGVESKFLNFPDENHWVVKPENSLVWHLVVLNWINSFVGLPKVVDREGRDGSEYVRQGKRKDLEDQRR